MHESDNITLKTILFGVPWKVKPKFALYFVNILSLIKEEFNTNMKLKVEKSINYNIRNFLKI